MFIKFQRDPSLFSVRTAWEKAWPSVLASQVNGLTCIQYYRSIKIYKLWLIAMTIPVISEHNTVGHQWLRVPEALSSSIHNSRSLSAPRSTGHRTRQPQPTTVAQSSLRKPTALYHLELSKETGEKGRDREREREREILSSSTWHMCTTCTFTCTAI